MNTTSVVAGSLKLGPEPGRGFDLKSQFWQLQTALSFKI